MKSNATWLIGAAALALAACSNGGPDEAGADASGDTGNEISTNATQTEAIGSPAEMPITPAPTSAATLDAQASGDVSVRRVSGDRRSEPAPEPQPVKQATPPATQEPAPTPSPTCAPEHRELGHC